MPHRHRVIKKKIGELLLERGVITKEQLENALLYQAGCKKLLGEILVELGYASEEDVVVSLTAQYGIPYLPLENYEISRDVINTVPAPLAGKYNFIPVDKIENLLTVVSSDILSEEAVEAISAETGCRVQGFITAPGILRKTMQKYYGENQGQPPVSRGEK